eukprot:gene12352-6020_t
MRKKEIITDLDTFGEFLNEFDQQHQTTQKQLHQKIKEEIINDSDTFGDFLGEFDEQHDLNKTLNQKHKSILSIGKLFHINENKKEITISDFPSKSLKLPKMTIEEYLKKYSLKHMLQYPKLREYLKKSSQKSFCAENVNFYEAILDFKKLKTQQERTTKANEMYNSYLALGSINEVNLSDEQKSIVQSKLENPSKNLFDFVEFEVQNMIKTENYYRFIHAEDDFAKMLEENENIIVLRNGTNRTSIKSF